MTHTIPEWRNLPISLVQVKTHDFFIELRWIQDLKWAILSSSSGSSEVPVLYGEVLDCPVLRTKISLYQAVLQQQGGRGHILTQGGN